MTRTTLLLVGLVLATTFVPAALADDPPAAPALRAVTQYFTSQGDGLAVSTVPPDIQTADAWTKQGSFPSTRGLVLEVPVFNVDPNVTIAEDEGVEGWMSASLKVQGQSLPLGVPTLFFYPQVKVSWLLVEGSRSSDLVVDCPYQDPYYCESAGTTPVYRGSFPGHGDAARPHTHASSPGGALTSSDFHWLLRATVSACPQYECPVGTAYQYTLSVVTDGSTFVTYQTPDAPAVPVTPSAPAGQEASADPATNSTSDGNSTDNTTGEGSSGAGAPGSAFEARAYDASAGGSSPGLPAWGLVVALTLGILMRRRRGA